MGSLVGTTLTIAILSLSSILIGATVTSVINSETESITADYNLEQLTSDAIEEISTYMQIRDKKGKFSSINGQQKIEKIAILISPLVSQKIDLSRLTIQLSNDRIVKILSYSGNLEQMDSSSLFEHSIWNKLKDAYSNELSLLAFIEIPDEKVVGDSFAQLVSRI